MYIRKTRLFKTFLLPFHGVSSKYPQGLHKLVSLLLQGKARNTVSFDKALLSEMLSDYVSRKLYGKFLLNEVTIRA